MSDVVIRAEGLGKKYVIGQQGEREHYTSLRDVSARRARGLARTAWDLMGGKLPARGDVTAEDFWALKDVNFKIKRGEVVGIIGRNGAGKSTLLKILSRITEPTEGRVEINGRVASLLEVGTGFHPELTGRENIYLNGAILGMSKAEIRRKFDEIIAFAEVEKFLDTPVKRYSSGMYVRLAFAVAAHLEPEILIVDEVLAVGDAEFQKKCLGKMKDVAGHGRTVLFVSHNMGAVRSLCNSAIMLAKGSIECASFGSLESLDTYNALCLSGIEHAWVNESNQFQNDYISIETVTFSSASGFLQIVGQIKKYNTGLLIGIGVYDSSNNLIFVSSDRDQNSPPLAMGSYKWQIKLHDCKFNNGTYFIRVGAYLHCVKELISMETGPALRLEIHNEFHNSPFWLESRPGILAPVLDWTVLGEV